MTLLNLSPITKNPLPWIIGLVGGGIVVLGVTTYTVVMGDATRFDLDEYTVPATEQTLRLEVEASGTVIPIENVNLSPTQAGIVQRLLVEQGMRVEEGQPIAVMDNEIIQAQGAQAEANLQQAAASLQEQQVRITQQVNQARARVAAAQARVQEAQARIPTEVRQAEAQIMAAQERVKRAEARLQRYEAPVQEGAISLNNVDDVALEYRQAAAQLAEAQLARQRAVSTAQPEITELQASLAEAEAARQEAERSAQAEIAQLQAAAKQAQAQLKEVQVRFEDSLITAPFDGIITQKYATQGAFVAPSTSASVTASATSTSIVAIARGLEVLARVPEVDIPNVRPRQPVEIRADAYPNQVFRGAVRLVAPEAVVEQNVTSFEVRIALAPEVEALLSGMNVDVTFLGQQLGQALTIPTVAVVTQDGDQGVYVLNANNEPEFKEVTLGQTVDDQTQVIAGLSPGERVFIDLPEGSDVENNNE
ncbi:efflux RND transporter periplasmic adaptor subunit [Spirulina sp. CS-785/01]|uniref:efflux RND transporter periplasmic adaptor subunit n=1 Tax=Spirulina sp. CS-785/01 TaxID=3021716 RepID=UPI00232B6704|nr:efflux RND transporter periplasmic adaptor subunit [Spirulina sp. CS-785/01]MDB9313168.1 efflux RND transporter periplasmic adaptor subunit [Spirulina sp. CS-785/01]